MGGARVPTRSGFSETIPAFNVEDSALSRLTNNIKSALQPLLNVFTGSPESAKIRWSAGVPTVALVPGSVHFQTDAVTTAASAIFVKQIPTTPVWEPIPGALGNLLFNGINSFNLNNVVPTTWAYVQTVPINGYIVMASSGSFRALAAGTQAATNAPASPKPLPITAGTIEFQIYLNGVGVGSTVILSPNEPASKVAYFLPGQVTFKPGDMVGVQCKGTGVTVSFTSQVPFSVWGG